MSITSPNRAANGSQPIRSEANSKSRRLAPVADLCVRRRAEHIVLGRFEQKATKKTKGASFFVSFVSFCRVWTPRRFGCLQCFAGAFPSEWEAGRHREFVGVGRRFLRLCEHDVVEPTGCGEPCDSVRVAIRPSVARGR